MFDEYTYCVDLSPKQQRHANKRSPVGKAESQPKRLWLAGASGWLSPTSGPPSAATPPAVALFVCPSHRRTADGSARATRCAACWRLRALAIVPALLPRVVQPCHIRTQAGRSRLLGPQHPSSRGLRPLVTVAVARHGRRCHREPGARPPSGSVPHMDTMPHLAAAPHRHPTRSCTYLLARRPHTQRRRGLTTRQGSPRLRGGPARLACAIDPCRLPTCACAHAASICGAMRCLFAYMAVFGSVARCSSRVRVVCVMAWRKLLLLCQTAAVLSHSCRHAVPGSPDCTPGHCSTC